MPVPELPAGVVKFHRQSNNHFYLWDGCFTNPMYDLNDPALGLGNDINAVYGVNLDVIPVEPADDDEFQAFQNFLQGRRNALVAQIAAAVNQ